MTNASELVQITQAEQIRRGDEPISQHDHQRCSTRDDFVSLGSAASSETASSTDVGCKNLMFGMVMSLSFSCRYSAALEFFCCSSARKTFSAVIGKSRKWIPTARLMALPIAGRAGGIAVSPMPWTSVTP